MTRRLTLEETWDLLGQTKMILPRDGQGRPLVPDAAPSYFGGGGRGWVLFRSAWTNDRLENLTLPRVFFCRSRIEGVSFRNTDLNQSHFCWNDFNDCDFTDADLTCCDLRSSIYVRCHFTRAKLLCADIRRGTFRDCDFTDADLTGALLHWEQDLDLSEEQLAQVDFRDEKGPEPPGG